jgi:hypothetical protein
VVAAPLFSGQPGELCPLRLTNNEIHIRLIVEYRPLFTTLGSLLAFFALLIISSPVDAAAERDYADIIGSTERAWRKSNSSGESQICVIKSASWLSLTIQSRRKNF